LRENVVLSPDTSLVDNAVRLYRLRLSALP
jgi:hypothetical protein